LNSVDRYLLTNTLEKKYKVLNSEIPIERDFKDSERSYECEATIDMAKPVYAIGWMLHDFLANFLKKNVISEEGGFEQSDDTWALYRHRKEQMRFLAGKSFDEMDRYQQEFFLHEARKMVFMLIDETIEKTVFKV
jgi:hypothetical protein